MNKLKHLVSIKDIDREDIERILDRAEDIEKNPEKYSDSLSGKILATLFFEPSTRTRLSFESAMLRLNGKIIGFADPKTSSVKKGESIADTIRMASAYSDIIVMRHFLEGSGRVAELYSDVPVISGGTGIQEHPTQCLLDLYTIRKEFGHIDNLQIGLLGDLRYGRTIPSLLYGLAKYNNVKVHLYSPPQLRARMTVLSDIDNKLDYVIEDNLHPSINNLDVLYVTRIQKERFPDQAMYERLKGQYNITPDDLENVKDNMIIMHPLPRVGEIDYKIDNMKYARYFQQAKNGIWTRMAILTIMMEDRL